MCFRTYQARAPDTPVNLLFLLYSATTHTTPSPLTTTARLPRDRLANTNREPPTIKQFIHSNQYQQLAKCPARARLATVCHMEAAPPLVVRVLRTVRTATLAVLVAVLPGKLGALSSLSMLFEYTSPVQCSQMFTERSSRTLFTVFPRAISGQLFLLLSCLIVLNHMVFCTSFNLRLHPCAGYMASNPLCSCPIVSTTVRTIGAFSLTERIRGRECIDTSVSAAVLHTSKPPSW